MATRSAIISRPDFGDRAPVSAGASSRTPDYGTTKYGPDGLLFSSADRGWSGLAAALFRHGDGVLSWKNTQPDTEICVDLRGNRSVVTRTGGGILDRTVARRGTIWMS